MTEDLDLFGSVGVHATATGTDVGEVIAKANLFVDDIDVTLTNSAEGAFVQRNVIFSTGIGASDVSFQKGFDVEAHAHGSDVAVFVGALASVALHAATHATASTANAHHVGGRIAIQGPATVIASANGYEVGAAVVALAALNAGGGGFLGSSANNVYFTAPVTVSANAHGSYVGVTSFSVNDFYAGTSLARSSPEPILASGTPSR